MHDQVAYLATLKTDGSPRLHPVRPVVSSGRLFMFVKATSPKVRDLERDPRYALHATATSDQPSDLREFGVRELLAASTSRKVVPRPTPAGLPARRSLPAVRVSIGSAFSTTYGRDGRPQRQRWRTA